MPKTREELTLLKEKYDSLATKFKELSEDELDIVTGGKASYGGYPEGGLVKLPYDQIEDHYYYANDNTIENYCHLIKTNKGNTPEENYYELDYVHIDDYGGCIIIYTIHKDYIKAKEAFKSKFPYRLNLKPRK